MSPALRAAVRIVAVVLLVLSLGLHWALLQTVAWTGMLVRFSTQGSLTEAVAKTFDGEHPCPLCHAIKQGRAEEKQQQQHTSPAGSKLEPGLVWYAPAFHHADSPAQRSPFLDETSDRADAPPKPRPRALSGLLAHA